MSVGITWRASRCVSDRGCVTTPASGRRTILGFVFEPCWRGRLHRWKLDASHGVAVISGTCRTNNKPRRPLLNVGASCLYYCRQRPTLPHSFPCSTIGGIRLNFRVRNGNGCDPDPMTTGILAAWGPDCARLASFVEASLANTANSPRRSAKGAKAGRPRQSRLRGSYPGFFSKSRQLNILQTVVLADQPTQRPLRVEREAYRFMVKPHG